MITSIFMSDIFLLYFMGSCVYQTVLCAKLTYNNSVTCHFSVSIYLTNLPRCCIDKCDMSTLEKTHVWFKGKYLKHRFPQLIRLNQRTLYDWKLLLCVCSTFLPHYDPTCVFLNMFTSAYPASSFQLWDVTLINVISHPVGGQCSSLI